LPDFTQYVRNFLIGNSHDKPPDDGREPSRPVIAFTRIR
jgi:hypothetical protein